jgi:hypothetical protein
VAKSPQSGYLQWRIDPYRPSISST